MRVKLIDYKAVELIPEFVDVFPDVPVEQRYSAEFLATCVQVDDDAEVLEGWYYDITTRTFSGDVPSYSSDSVYEEIAAAIEAGVNEV